MRGLLKRLTPSTGIPLIVASIIAGFVLAISVTASAQYLTGRGVDMRSLSGQAASCRAPALKLKQEIIILRQDLSEILECNSEGSFFVDGDCVPYITPGHAFQADYGAANEDALSFDDPGGPQWAKIGGADGPDVECVPQVTCETGSPDWPDCICDPDSLPYNPTHHLCFDPECDPEHNDPECCDQYPGASICNSGPVCEEGHNDPSCCSAFPDSPTCEDECVEDTDTRQGSCPEGEVGWVEEASYLVCPEAGDAYWTDWEPVEGGAFCCNGEKTESCPSGQEGEGITYTRTSCDDTWSESSRDCSDPYDCPGMPPSCLPDGGTGTAAECCLTGDGGAAWMCNSCSSPPPTVNICGAMPDLPCEQVLYCDPETGQYECPGF